MRPDPGWLAFAENDLEAARVLSREEIWNQVCFHAQQSAEKFLKSAIPAQDRPRSHKLADLLNRVESLELSEEMKRCLRRLDRFYIPSRYPDALPGALEEGLPSESDANEALAKYFPSGPKR